jgi:hypothetical protein
MQLDQPKNHAILLRNRALHPEAPAIARPEDLRIAYMGSGCHPDIVERIWDAIGTSLPEDCRFLVYGVPALVHPSSQLIFAMGVGTQYALRLLPAVVEEAKTAGAKTTTTWSGGSKMHIDQEFGADWVFGAWLSQEPGWCQAVYNAENNPP